MSTHDHGYLPALRFRVLTPLFDAVVSRGAREGVFKKRLLDQAGLQSDQRVLDLGCGTGTLALMAKDRAPGAEVVGLDADPDILSRAREKAHRAGVEIAFDRGTSDDLPYDDHSFDRVLSTLFFHHLPRSGKEKTAKEIARVLKPGGELHVGDFGPPIDPLMRLLFLQIRVFDGFERTRDNVRGQLPVLFRDAGLREVEETNRMRAPFGSLSLYKAGAPKGG